MGHQVAVNLVYIALHEFVLRSVCGGGVYKRCFWVLKLPSTFVWQAIKISLPSLLFSQLHVSLNPLPLWMSYQHADLVLLDYQMSKEYNSYNLN